MSKVAEEYLKFQNDTSWYKHSGEGNAPELSYLILGLVGEAGEAADEVKKIVRLCGQKDDEQFKVLMTHPEHWPKLLKEMGDVLWYYNKLLDFMGLDMETLMVQNTYKLYNRLLDREHFKELDWPFSDPELSYDKLHERLGG